jgi:endonuclease/exonuclease/phosphatase family metal-dependent hydrolase
MKNVQTRLAASMFTAAGFVLCAAASASAQSTITLTNGNATTLRGGAYASTNYGSSQVLETRASSDATYVRRALFKFDTHSIPLGTPIANATLTVTVASGSDGETRQISAYNEPDSYDEAAATWNNRKSGVAWSQAGGTVGSRYAVASVTGTAGSKVIFDVTQLVAAVVRGDFDPNSRYTHLLLIDGGSSSRTSYKQYYSNEASDASSRPTLTIVTGTSTSTTTTTTTTTSTSSSGSTAILRVLQWNTHHGGYGTDGVLDQNRLATWAASFKPDVVMFNEIELNDYWGHVNGPEVYKTLLEQKTGKTWYYIFAQEFGQWGSTGKGNLILSSIPFNSTNRYELPSNNDRSIAEANITVNGRSITLLSTHLDPSDATLRLTQATEVVNWAAGEPENRIITGDMNAWPDQTSIAEYDTKYYDSWVVAQSEGTALAFSGNNGETKNGRIDYIFYSKSAGLAVKSSQVYDTRDSNGVMPSDHRPVLTVFTVK